MKAIVILLGLSTVFLGAEPPPAVAQSVEVGPSRVNAFLARDEILESRELLIKEASKTDLVADFPNNSNSLLYTADAVAKMPVSAGAKAETDPETIEFLKISPSEISALLDEATSTKTETLLAAKAVRAHRADLVEICFNHSKTAHFTVEAIAKMPESESKDQLTLLLLKSDSYYWPRNEPYQDGSRGAGISEYFHEPFTSLLHKHLPGKTFTSDVLKTLASRCQLATEVEAAIAKAGSLETSPDQERKDGKSQRVPNSSVTGSARTSGTVAKDLTASESKPRSHWLLLSFVAACAMALLGWAIKKGKSRAG